MEEGNKNFTIQQGEEAFKNEDYELSSRIFLELWNNPDNRKGYLLSCLGRSLRKEDRCKEFIDICRELDQKKEQLQNRYVQSELCWCLYHAHIKYYSIENQDEYDDFINRAKYIVKNSDQRDADEFCITPYVLTVIKVVKVMKKKATKPYKKIIEWLSYLEPDKLPCDAYEFVDERGKQRELASPKEFYYYIISKAYEQTKDYKKCIEACKAGLEQVEKLHYRNHIWLKARKQYCECLILGDNDEAIENYTLIADKEQHWYMYHKLSNLFFIQNEMDKSLLYASKAYSGRFEDEKMVNLLLDTGILWYNRDKRDNARVFFQASAYYRNIKGWRVPEELEFYIFDMELNIISKPNVHQIKTITSDYVDSIEGTDDYCEGIINNIKRDRGFGFIEPINMGENIFFRLKNVRNRERLFREDPVKYIIKEENGRVEAINVRKRR